MLEACWDPVASASYSQDAPRREASSVTSMRMNQLVKLILMLAAVSAASPVCAGARLLAEWSAVQETEPVRRVRIALYEDRAPGGPVKFDGTFASASSDNLALVLRDGSTRTFARPTVRRVSRRRPVHKRPEAWVVAELQSFPKVFAARTVEEQAETP